MTPIEIAINLGKQIAASQKILCPVCSPEAMDGEQPMSAFGDFENTLFCPHCDMTVELDVEL